MAARRTDAGPEDGGLGAEKGGGNAGREAKGGREFKSSRLIFLLFFSPAAPFLI